MPTFADIEKKSKQNKTFAEIEGKKKPAVKPKPVSGRGSFIGPAKTRSYEEEMKHRKELEQRADDIVRKDPLSSKARKEATQLHKLANAPLPDGVRPPSTIGNVKPVPFQRKLEKFGEKRMEEAKGLVEGLATPVTKTVATLLPVQAQKSLESKHGEMFAPWRDVTEVAHTIIEFAPPTMAASMAIDTTDRLKNAKSAGDYVDAVMPAVMAIAIGKHMAKSGYAETFNTSAPEFIKSSQIQSAIKKAAKNTGIAEGEFANHLASLSDERLASTLEQMGLKNEAIPYAIGKVRATAELVMDQHGVKPGERGNRIGVTKPVSVKRQGVHDQVVKDLVDEGYIEPNVAAEITQKENPLAVDDWGMEPEIPTPEVQYAFENSPHTLSLDDFTKAYVNEFGDGYSAKHLAKYEHQQLVKKAHDSGVFVPDEVLDTYGLKKSETPKAGATNDAPLEGETVPLTPKEVVDSPVEIAQAEQGLPIEEGVKAKVEDPVGKTFEADIPNDGSMVYTVVEDMGQDHVMYRIDKSDHPSVAVDDHIIVPKDKLEGKVVDLDARKADEMSILSEENAKADADTFQKVLATDTFKEGYAHGTTHIIYRDGKKSKKPAVEFDLDELRPDGMGRDEWVSFVRERIQNPREKGKTLFTTADGTPREFGEVTDKITAQELRALQQSITGKKPVAPKKNHGVKPKVIKAENPVPGSEAKVKFGDTPDTKPKQDALPDTEIADDFQLVKQKAPDNPLPKAEPKAEDVGQSVIDADTPKSSQNAISEADTQKRGTTQKEAQTQEIGAEGQEIGASRQPWEMTADEYVAERQAAEQRSSERIEANHKEWKANTKTVSQGENKRYQKRDSDMNAFDKSFANRKVSDWKRQHRMALEEAISKGETVPESVMKDYPDLAKASTPKQTGEAVAKKPAVARSSGGSGTAAFKDAGTAVMPRVSSVAKSKSAEPVKASDIVKDLEKAFAPIRTGRFRQKALGIFKIRENVIRTGKANNLPTIAHEVGHALQKMLWPEARTGRGDLSSKAFPKEYWGELSPLAYPGAKKKMTEGYAEFIRLYLTDPSQARAKAPTFFNFFESKLNGHPQIKTVLAKSQKDIALWIDQPEQARVRSTISRGKPDSKRAATLDSIYTQWIDELRPLQLAEREITGGADIPASKSPFKEAWRGRGIAGKSEEWLSHGVTDASGKKVGESLKEILSPVARELDDFIDYAVSVHGIDVIKAKGKNAMPLDIRDYQAVVDNAPEGYADALKNLVDFQDRLLDELVKSGLMTRESKKAMRDKWPNHVPLYRVMDDGANVKKGVGKGQANVQSPIRRLKGSGRDIIDPIESIVKDTYVILNVAQRNRVMTKLVDLAGSVEDAGRIVEYVPPKLKPTTVQLGEVIKVPEFDPTWADLYDILGINPEDTATIFRPNYLPANAENIVRVFQDGKPKLYQLDPELYTAVTAQDTLTSDVLTKILSTPASVLRAGATLTPEFAIRNPMRDIMTAMINSEYGLKPWDLPRAMYHVLGKTDLYHQWKASGAAHATMVSLDRNYLQGSLRELTRQKPSEKVIDFVTHPIDALRAFGEFTEASTRVAEFGKGTKWGKETDINKLIDAAISSRDVTIDFSRAGNIGKKVNKMVAFFNASIGGADKLARVFKENPGRSTLRAATWITAPTVALYFMNRDNPRYQQLPEWEKDLFWIIPTTEDGPMIRIPKPFELGIIFGTLPERVLRHLDQEDPHAFDEYARNAVEAMTPGVLPTALVPWVQVISNKSFAGTPIVPEREKRLPKQLQYGPNTTGLARFVGEKAKVSPRQVDTMIQGYGGGLGRYAAQGAGRLLEEFGLTDTPPMPDTTISQKPVIRGLLVNEYSSPVQVERLYEEMGKLKEKEHLFNAGNGPDLTQKEYERLWELEERADALSDQRAVMREIYSAESVSELRDILKDYEIPKSPGTIGKQKQAAIAFLKKQEASIAEGGDKKPQRFKVFPKAVKPKVVN
jgi:hypothetical protein